MKILYDFRTREAFDLLRFKDFNVESLSIIARPLN